MMRKSSSVAAQGLLAVATCGITYKLLSMIISRRSCSSSSKRRNSNSIKISVIGDAFTDILIGPVSKLPEWGQDTLVKEPFQIMAGGSALNTVVQMAALEGLPPPPLPNGRPSPPIPPVEFTFHSRIGADSFGSILLDRLFQAGVKPSLPKGHEKVGSGACLVLTGPRDRAFVTYGGAVSELGEADLDLDLLRGASHVHVGGYYNCPALRPALPRLLRALRAPGGGGGGGATTSLVPQSDATGRWDGLGEVLPHVDVLLVNQDEAFALTGMDDPVEAVSAFLKQGAGVVVVTMGKQGAVAGKMHAGKEIVYRGSTKKVKEVVDTTGAGDAFCAGFLYAWKTTDDIPYALELAACSGAYIVTKFGASVTPTHKDIQDLLNQE